MRVLYHHPAGAWLRRKLEETADGEVHVEVVPPSDDRRFRAVMEDTEVLWHVLRPVRGPEMDLAPRLRLIQKIGVGVNTIDLDAARRRSIAVANMPGTNSAAVAEMTLALMLAAVRRLETFHRQTVSGNGWDLSTDLRESPGEIGARTVGLVGYGSIPRRLAPVLAAMGARIVYTATTPKTDAVGEWKTLRELFKLSDIVSLHVPLTEETESLIDAEALELMKPGSILVNTSRGGVVDQAALVRALRSGRLAVAALDVFTEEPVPDGSPILELPNVVCTPHVAWMTRETITRSLEIAVDNCRRLREGRPLLHQVA